MGQSTVGSEVVLGKGRASLSLLRRPILLGGLAAVGLFPAAGAAATAVPSPDPSPAASTTRPDPPPEASSPVPRTPAAAAPTRQVRTPAVRSPARAAPVAAPRAVPPREPEAKAKPKPKPEPEPATPTAAQKAPPAAPERRRSTFGLPGRIDQSLPTAAVHEARIEPMLLAALGLFPLLLASTSLLWLLHVRAEAYR